MEEKEVRFNGFECRSEGDELILEGYPIIWDAWTLIGDAEYGFYEAISRGAVDPTALKDVPLKYNHCDSVYILARTRNRSLVLEPDDYGLKMWARLQNDVQTHKDVYSMVKSGLLDKMSFAFTVAEQQIDTSQNIPRRNVIKIKKLYDVSVVDTPAYDQSLVYARSIALVETKRKALESAGSSVDIDKVVLERLRNQNLIKGIYR